MDEREKHVLQVLRDALDTAPDGRDEFVSEQCAGDTALRDRVVALLHAIGDSDADEPAERSVADAESERATRDDVLVGAQLGPFRVEERIGRGGMGVVYRGVRTGADFTQEVAIKLIRRGFDFDDVQARFLRERRILARLTHPNLARFIDGGVSPEGRPWFALEFVRGATITRWCDARGLDLRARVTLFLGVCAAVQYAHTQLVVHRDLKPGKVLVDAEGLVRLLDFGVAGLLSGVEENARERPTTIAPRRALTPEYAAPEQFGSDGAGVAVDVYALGVILYELLSGVLPYELDRNDIVAAERTVRETPPQPLHLAVSRGAPGEAVERLRLRNEAPHGFRNAVRGDLSRIVEKALAKEPSRRYATVDAFASDLARWLAGSPVQVSGNGVGYRLGKFAKRNRVAIALGATALVLIVALSLFHVVSLNRQLEQTKAQRERAQASLGFLQRLLSSPDPQTEFGPQSNLGDFLAQAYATTKASADVDPDVRDEIGLTIAASLRGIERYDDALAMLDGIEKSPQQTADAERHRVAALSGIGEIETLQGKYEQALQTLDRAAALAEQKKVTDPLVVADLLSAQSVANNHLAQWDASARLIDRAIEVAAPISESEPAFYANLLGFASIPRAYPRTDLPGAEALLRRSLAFQEAHSLVASGLYPNTKGELAQALIDQGRFEDAEPMLLDVIAQMKQRYGENNRETSFKLSNLALLYLRWNRMDEARRWRDDATRSMTAALGDKHPFLALDLIQSADVAFYAGDPERAALDARKGAAIADEQDRAEFAAKADLYDAYSRCLHGDAAALATLRERLRAAQGTFGVRVFDVRLAAADCLSRQGLHDESVAAIEPFERDLAAGKPISRTDYLLPAIKRIRDAAPVATNK
jgi:serine/threonine-protein kinase